MRKFILITACFLIFQNGAPVKASHGASDGASDLKRSVDVLKGVQRNDLPRAFLSKSEGSVEIRKQGESIALRADKSTLDEILQRIAEETKVILKFYCHDPGLEHERTNLRISADSIVKVLRQMLSEDHRITLLDREGKPTENGKDAAAIHIYPEQCTGMDHPVRVFIAQRAHPLLSKPPDEISIEELRDVLRREGPASRRRAADTLGIKGDEKGIPCAKEALKDENIGVMFAAAHALRILGQKYGSEKVVDAIYERFRERPYPEFLPVMAQLDREKFWPMIDGLMDQSDERERGFIEKALFLTNDRRAIKYLSKIASTGIVEISMLAISAIGKLGGPEAAMVLMKLLREGDAQRQAGAARAVHFLPEDEGLDVRAEVEKIVRQEKVSDTFLYALAEVSYLEPLKTLMTDPASKPERKLRALKTMVDVGSQKSIEVISIGLNDKAPQVRLASVEALGALGVEAAIPHLIKATEDEDAKVRRGAAKGLSEFPGDDRVVAALGKALEDTDENVRRQAVNALAALGRPRDATIAILRNCKNHKDPYVVNKAGSILSQWGLK